MRANFETGKISEVEFFGGLYKVTMNKSSCFEIRKYNSDMNRYNLIYETSKNCTWEFVLKLINI